MTSIGGLSSNTTSSLQGYGGLASGLDRDSLIESMTYGTRLQIDSAYQDRQSTLWEQEAIRNITNELYEFTQKYTSYTSSSNLLSTNLFQRKDVEILGENSKFVSVLGTNVSNNPISILGVQSLAKDAQGVSSGNVTSGVLTSNVINESLSNDLVISEIAGESITFTYDSEEYTLTLPKDSEMTADGMDTIGEVATLLNEAAAEIDLGGGKTFADIFSAQEVDGKLVFKNTSTESKSLTIKSDSGNLMRDLGFLEADGTVGNLEDAEKIIGTSGFVAEHTTNLSNSKSAAEIFSNATMTFNYNDKVYTIELGEYTDETSLATVQEDIQKELNDKIGNGRITVSLEDAVGGKALSFKTTSPDGLGGVKDDTTSVFSITAASPNILGDGGILGIKAGDGNRLNLHGNLKDAGLTSDIPTTDMTFSSAGVEVNLADHGLTWESSIEDIIDTINSLEDLDINIVYQKETDKFVVKSTQSGASGSINLSGNVADILFNTPLNVTNGQDAVVRVKYADSGEEVDITRSSNTIDVDGMSITLKGEFGFTQLADSSYEYIQGTEAITFEGSIDTQETADIVKEFIDDYNEAILLINTAVSERPDRDYQPLTDAQKAEMSESEIENWETEAKKGLLFNDSTIRSLADELRFIIPSSMRQQFEDMGITVSDSYTDNGKLIFDQAKFEEALAEDPNAVYEAFNAKTGTDGAVENGILTEMKNVMDRYAGTTGYTKGLLVERAGFSFAPTSILDNYYQTMIDSIDDRIERLQDTLTMEEDRYVQQFTNLETLISQMNSQSSYISQMLGTS